MINMHKALNDEFMDRIGFMCATPRARFNRFPITNVNSILVFQVVTELRADRRDEGFAATIWFSINSTAFTAFLNTDFEGVRIRVFPEIEDEELDDGFEGEEEEDAEPCVDHEFRLFTNAMTTMSDVLGECVTAFVHAAIKAGQSINVEPVVELEAAVQRVLPSTLLADTEEASAIVALRTVCAGLNNMPEDLALLAAIPKAVVDELIADNKTWKACADLDVREIATTLFEHLNGSIHFLSDI